MIKEEDVRSVANRNLMSTILLCQHVSRQMMERKTGRIITISSIRRVQEGNANSAIYSTARPPSSNTPFA